MTGVKFDFSEIQEMTTHIDDVIPEALQDAFNQAALLTTGEAKKLINRGPKTGKTYEKYNPRRTHKASSPGESPATDTGSLVSSLKEDTKSPTQVTRVQDARSTAGSTNKEADWLENGTANIADRPFMLPSFLKVNKKLIGLIRHANKKRLRKDV